MARNQIVSTQTFTAADGAAVSDDANWLEQNANNGQMQILANAFYNPFGNAADCAWQGAGSFTDNQYAVIKLIGDLSEATAVDFIGITLRAQNAFATRTMYRVAYYMNTDGGGPFVRVFKIVSNGAPTQLGADIAAAGWASGDTLEAEAVTNGSTCDIFVYHNGSSLATRTDSSSIITGGKPGICGLGSVTTLFGDDFTAGNVISYTVEQEGYRWRDDDGDEDGASWFVAQDTEVTRAPGAAARLRVLLNGTNDPASAQYQVEYKLSSDSVYRKVEVAGGGALAFGTIGAATTTGTTAPTVAYPASLVAGDLLILAIVNRPNANTVTTPSGWTAPANNTTTGGAGSEAAGTGLVRVTIFTKVADGTESGSLTLTISGGTSVGARMWRVTRTTGKDYEVVLAIGSDNSAGTGWSVTFGSDPSVITGDLVFVASGSSEDTPTFAAEAMSQTGVTWGTVTELADNAIATGNDCHLVVSQHDVTSGPSSAPAVFTMTASGTNAANSAGCSIMVRIRQIDQPIQLALSANIAASGEATTAQLTAPSGKSTSDFVAGRMQDDENPADAVDITTDDYTEMEWSTKSTAVAQEGQAYDLRVTDNGAPLQTYTVTPRLNVSSVGPLPPILLRRAPHSLLVR